MSRISKQNKLLIAALLVTAVLLGAFCFANWPTAASAKLTETYRDEPHHFSLRYPAAYTAQPTATETPDIYFVFLQSSSGANIQITITPALDEGSTLTVGSLLSDYPYIADKLTAPFKLDPNVIGIAIFTDKAALFPDNIWIEHGGYFYQFTASGPAIQELPAIVRSLEFT